MYGPDEMPMVRLEGTVCLACQEYFVLGQEEEHLRDLWCREATRDLGRMFEVLSELWGRGARPRARRPPLRE